MKETTGLYIHIPFCKTKCLYCNFFSTISYKKENIKIYIDYLLKEFLIRRQFCKKTIDTIYLGGGSPSVIETKTLKIFFDELSKVIDFNKIKETTIEINPADTNNDLINFISTLPSSRVSVGIQTLNEKILNFIKRNSSLKEIENCFNIIEGSKIKNVSLDFIVSTPYSDKYQTASDIEKSLQLLKKTNHISMYYLEFEEKETLKNKWEKFLMSEEESIESYNIAVKLLKEKGFERYEISSFAKNNNYSKHNMHYWSLDEYIAIGLSASGFYNLKRYQNTKNLKEYFSNLDNNNTSESYFEIIDESKKELEFIFLSLRMKTGICLKTYNNIFKTDFLTKYKNIIDCHSEYFFINNFSIAIAENYINLTDEISILFF